MKYAKFDTGHDCSIIWDERLAKHTDYPRISEWVEIEFPPRDPSEVVPEQLAALDQQEAELRSQFQRRLDEINGNRANLLALTSNA